MSEFYVPGAEHGVRWDDPVFDVEWPLKPTEIAERDRLWANYSG
jgi:dTDP-4-dehydrorhamnose 3,5-epimerase